MSQNQPVKPHEGVDKSTSVGALSKTMDCTCWYRYMCVTKRAWSLGGRQSNGQ